MGSISTKPTNEKYDLDRKAGRNSYVPNPKRPPLPDPPKPTEKILIRALYDYNFQCDARDLNFKENDMMEIIEDDGDWWFARSVKTNKMGLVPKNYVALIRSLENHSWFHGSLNHFDSGKLLEHPHNDPGTFMIRNSATMSGFYVLSVLSPERNVKHYRIKTMDNGKYYIFSKCEFQDMEELTDYYKKHAKLCCLLTKSCSKGIPVLSEITPSMKDKWEIDRKKIELRHKIGSGNFGEVWKGLCLKRPVAIKIMKPGTMEKNKFLDEAAVMKNLRHSKLIRLYGVCSAEEPIYIITEFMPNGCLHSYLKQDGGRTLKFNHLVDFAAQVASGMQYIESKSYIHRDLATRNVLVGENNMVKIGDFGLARALEENVYQAADGAKLPVRWTAVETLNHQIYTIKSDVWAFGILLVELVTYGALPYQGLNNQEVIEKIKGSYRHPKPGGCNEEIFEIMLNCWHKDPERRPSFDHLFHLLDDFVIATETAYA